MTKTNKTKSIQCIPNSSITCKSCAYFEVAFADCCAEEVVKEDNCDGVRSVGTPDVNDGWTDGTLDVTICGVVVIEDIDMFEDIGVEDVNIIGVSLDVGFSSITKSMVFEIYEKIIVLNDILL